MYKTQRNCKIFLMILLLSVICSGLVYASEMRIGSSVGYACQIATFTYIQNGYDTIKVKSHSNGVRASINLDFGIADMRAGTAYLRMEMGFGFYGKTKTVVQYSSKNSDSESFTPAAKRLFVGVGCPLVNTEMFRLEGFGGLEAQISPGEIPGNMIGFGTEMCGFISMPNGLEVVAEMKLDLHFVNLNGAESSETIPTRGMPFNGTLGVCIGASYAL